MNLTNKVKFERWEKVNGIWRETYHSEKRNLVVTTGLNEFQKEFWTGAAYTASLFIGLINNALFTSIALGDTAAQINGTNAWKEVILYSEANRQTLTMGTAVAGSLDNSAAQAIFTVSTGFTLNGAFISTSNVKNGTGGILIGAVSAPSPIPFLIGQQIRITISSTLSN